MNEGGVIFRLLCTDMGTVEPFSVCRRWSYSYTIYIGFRLIRIGLLHNWLSSQTQLWRLEMKWIFGTTVKSPRRLLGAVHFPHYGTQIRVTASHLQKIQRIPSNPDGKPWHEGVSSSRPSCSRRFALVESKQGCSSSRALRSSCPWPSINTPR